MAKGRKTGPGTGPVGLAPGGEAMSALVKHRAEQARARSHRQHEAAVAASREWRSLRERGVAIRCTESAYIENRLRRLAGVR